MPSGACCQGCEHDEQEGHVAAPANQEAERVASGSRSCQGPASQGQHVKVLLVHAAHKCACLWSQQPRAHSTHSLHQQAASMRGCSCSCYNVRTPSSSVVQTTAACGHMLAIIFIVSA